MTLRPQFFWLALAVTLGFQPPARAQVWRWANPQPNGNNIVDMTWNGSLGVEVAELGQIYTSPDMLNWYPCVNANTNDLQAVRFFGSRIVVCGQNGLVGYSDDGVNFSCTNLNFSSGYWLVGLAASSNLVIAVGDNADIYTSPDGANWTGPLANQPPNNTNYDWLTGAAWHGGTFVICGEQGYIANSTDGLHYTNQNSGIVGNGNTGNFEAVTWLAGSGSLTNFPYPGFWAVTDDGRAVYSTNNGTTWKTFSPEPSTNVLYTLAGNSSTVALSGDEDVELGSLVTNNLAWANQTGLLATDAPLWTYFASLWSTNAYATNGAYYLTGYYGLLVQSTNNNGNYNWSQPYLTVRDWLWQVAVVNGLYVAVGDNARIMNSDNGVDWSIEEVPATNSVSATNTVFFCVGGNTNLFIAAGNQGSVALSPNTLVTVTATNTDGTLYTNTASTIGIIWNPLPANLVPTTNDLVGVCCFSNRFYLVGGNGTILNSLDGTNWAALASPTTGDLTSITPYTNGLILVGDQGLIFTSVDGTNWTKRNSNTGKGLLRVKAFGNELLVLGENGALLTSTNATNWTSINLPSTTNWLNDAVMVSNTCYVVGDDGVVLASTNFVNWTQVPMITTSSLFGAATQNGQLVVVGFEGSILQSQIVPDLTPVKFVDYAQASGENIFLVAGAVDQEFTLDASTNLFNWTTGSTLDLENGDGTLLFYTPVATNTPQQFYRCTLSPQ